MAILAAPAPETRSPGLSRALAALERALDDVAAAQARAVEAGDAAAQDGAVGPLDHPVDDPGQSVLRLLRAQRRLGAITAVAADRFDASGVWADAGARSGADWLTRRINDSFGALRRQVAQGAVIRHRPALAAALRDGSIGAQHAAAVDRAARDFPRLAAALDDNADHLVDLARRHDPVRFRRHLLALCHRLDPQAVDDAEQERRREAFLTATERGDGMVRVDGLLPKELGHLLIASLEAGRRTIADSPDDARPRSSRNLDALQRILAAAAAATGDDGLPRINGARPTAVVLIPLETLLADPAAPEVAWLERFGITTEAVTALEARRLACDSTLEPVLIDRDGRMTAAAPRRRTIPHHLRRAVQLRDRHCRGPNCGQRIDEVHHIRFFSRGGRTEMANLVGLCFRCHQLAHHGWRITGDPGVELRWESPGGEVLLCAT